MIDRFRFLYQDLVRSPSAAPTIPERALHLASALQGTIPWVQRFLRFSPTSRQMLANLLTGYIHGVEGESGWRLEVDSRLSICFCIQQSISKPIWLFFSSIFQYSGGPTRQRSLPRRSTRLAITWRDLRAIPLHSARGRRRCWRS